MMAIFKFKPHLNFKLNTITGIIHPSHHHCQWARAGHASGNPPGLPVTVSGSDSPEIVTVTANFEST
jgi:hypothetical protein